MVYSLMLALLAAKAHAASCRAKTNAEKGYLAEAGCPNANPTSCTCSTNQQTASSCPGPSTTLWASTGKMCVTATPDKNSNWEKHDWQYPADFWNYCPPQKGDANSAEATWQYWTEPGSYHCTKVDGQTHQWVNPSAGYNSYYNSTGWCTSPGCYVDPCTCNAADIASSSWFKRQDGGKIYYSYEVCGGTNTFTQDICNGLSSSQANCETENACIWDNTTTAPNPGPPAGTANSSNTTAAPKATTSGASHMAISGAAAFVLLAAFSA